jgi:hypothetical protein
MVEKNGCFQIIGRFFIEFAQANLDAHIQPSEVLYRHIEEIQKYMPEMVDYLRRVSREGLQQYKQTLRGIRKRGRHPEALRQAHASLPHDPTILVCKG